MSTLHIVGANTNSQLIHTLSASRWQAFFGNVQQAANNSNIAANEPQINFNPIDVATLQYRKRVHTIVLTQTGRIVYTYRKNNGKWRRFADLTPTLASAFNLPNGIMFTKVACASYGSTLFVCVLTNTGRVLNLQKRIMNNDIETWGANFMPDSLNDNNTARRDLTCFTVSDKLYVGCIYNDGRLIRSRYILTETVIPPSNYSTGFYTLGLDRSNQSTIVINNQNLPDPIAVSGAYARDKEHFVVCTRAGALLHHQTGQNFFGDVNAANGGAAVTYKEVACAELDSALEIAAVSANGTPFHTRYKRRNNSWRWQGFMGNISTQASGAGSMTCIAVS